jgi:hypothetical protein
MQIWPKDSFPKLKTFCLAGFLRNRAKVRKSLGKVLDETLGIPAKEATSPYQWAGQPYLVLATGAEHLISLFQSQNCIINVIA